MSAAEILWAVKAGLQMRRDPMPLFRQLAARNSGERKIFILSKRTHIITSVGDVRHILRDNPDNYHRDYVSFEQVMGKSLLMSHGERWRTLRSAHEAAFHGNRLGEYVAPIEAAVTRTAKRWSNAAARGKSLNLSRSMSGLMLDVTARALFRSPPPCSQQEFHEHMSQMSATLNQRALRMLPVLRNLALSGSRRYRAALERWHGLAAEVRTSAERGGETASLLSLIEQVAREVAENPGDIEQQVHDDILGYLVAGTHTTATTLGWAFHLLAQNPEIADRLRHEATTILAGSDKAPRELDELRHTRMVLQETMRLYPPAWCFILTAHGNDRLEHCTVRRGERVALCMPSIYRDARYWDQPDAFRPERFSASRARAREPYSYLPFGAGQRTCIGGRFAMMEMSLALARLVSRFRFTSADPGPVRLEAGIVLKPANDLYLKVTPLH